MALTVLKGSSQYAEANGSPLPGTATTFTLAGWVKPTTLTAGTFLSTGHSGAASYVALAASAAGLPFTEVAVTGASSSSTHTVAMIVGTWHHLAAVQSAANSRVVYRDGVASVANTVSRTPSGLDRVTLGALVSNGVRSSFQNAALAETAIWDVALTADEVASLNAGISPLLIRPASLKFYGPLHGIGSPEQDWRGGLALTYGAAAAAPTTSPHVKVFRPSTIPSFGVPVAAGGTSVTLTPATEASGAEALTMSKRASLESAVDTSEAVGLTAAKVMTLVPAVEGADSVALAVVKTMVLEPAVEADMAVGLTRQGAAVALQPADEADEALPVVARKLVALVPASESDTATPLVIAIFHGLTPTMESDAALALSVMGASQVLTLTSATEADLALGLTAQLIPVRRVLQTRDGSGGRVLRVTDG